MSAERRRARGGRNAGDAQNRKAAGGPDGAGSGGGGGGGGSRRNRRSRRGRGGGPSGGGAPAGGAKGRSGDDRQGGNRGRNRKGGGNTNRRRRQEHLHDRDRFWGDPAALPEVEQDVTITDHPAAVPLSLGPPPLPGHEKIAEHYFGVVYERAVTTAGALAAAGGLIDPASLLGEDDTD